MRREILSQSNEKATRSGASRRMFVKGAVAGLTATSLAGCVGSGVFGGRGGTDTVFIGGTVPLSGPYGVIGQNEKKAIELAVKHANEQNDAGDRKVKIEFKDTKTKPSVGTQAARELIRNGADFLAGNFSSSVALAIGELAQRKDTLYQCVGGALAITGSECRPNVFDSGNSAVMQTSAGLRYVLAQNDTGSSVYEISADYSWGQSIQNWNKNHIVPKFDAKYLGNTFVPLGANSYASAITKARNSGADIISFNLFASDFVQSARAAASFGLFNDHVCVWPATGIIPASKISQEVLSSENFFGSVPWYWQQETPAATKFSDSFHREYDTRPLGFSASMYSAVRTTLKAINATGSTKVSELQKELEGRKLFPQLWGVGEKFRACDHRATIATMAVRGRPKSEVSGQNYYKILWIPENPIEKTMRTCEQTGCTF